MVSSATPQPSAQPAAAAPSTPSCNDTTAAKSDPSGLIATSVATLATLAAKTTPKASSNATPTDTTIPIATTATLAAKTTPYTHAQVAPAAEACFGLINCPASAASAQSATTTQSPPTFTATPSTKSTTSTTNITPAAGATCALIKRAPVAVSPSTPTPLPRPVATPFFTPATFTTKPRPIDAVPSATVDFTPVQQAQPSQSILGDCTLHTVAINTSTTAQRHTHRRQASHTYIQDNLHT
ncbi:hypothetical protein BJ741DRAFT_627501 [Chytriomyces cf. hyalinus JEL632]|nr:hypothetical protein BJ741DRAFT_627501 [Chytriomyces cf. hyalinus JEL632]